MPTSPEQEKEPQQIKKIEFRPEDIEVRPDIEREMGVKQVPSQFTSQVTDDSGQQLIKTTSVQQVTVQMPGDDTQLADWSKGSPVESLTWFAMFWLRIIKKALHFGWNIVRRQQ